MSIFFTVFYPGSPVCPVRLAPLIARFSIYSITGISVLYASRITGPGYPAKEAQAAGYSSLQDSRLYTIPCASIASTTFSKPAMLAPAT